jgi:D-alanyl-D-alanine carboxypeptidase
MAMRIVGLARGATGLKLFAAACLVAAAVGAVPQTATAAPDSSIIVDAKTGKTLYAQAPDAKRYPASLTKMMTLYLLFDALEARKTSLNARIKVSAHAAGQAPSKLGLKPGQTIRVRDAILALVTKSANDVAVAIGEYLGGTESAFAQKMTRKAHELGMSRTTFRNASGLPNSGQVTTARDMATLGRALQEHHPEYFSYFSTPSFVWQGRRIGNHDHLLGRVKGVNGIKTGYTRASGFNLVSSVTRGNRQIVGVVMGGETSRWRDQRMASLITTYLPAASTGTRIASVPGATRAIARIDPKDLPVPQPRPTIDDGSTASIADAATPAAPADRSGKPATAIASLIGANSIFALDATDATDAQPVDQGDASGEDDTSDAASAGTVITGWKVQLAATPSQSSAEDVLDQALSKGSAVLAKASPYTEPVTVGDTTLYRARFAGFVDKNQARAACAYLTRHDFKCLALHD